MSQHYILVHILPFKSPLPPTKTMIHTYIYCFGKNMNLWEGTFASAHNLEWQLLLAQNIIVLWLSLAKNQCSRSNHSLVIFSLVLLISPTIEKISSFAMWKGRSSECAEVSQTHYKVYFIRPLPVQLRIRNIIVVAQDYCNMMYSRHFHSSSLSLSTNNNFCDFYVYFHNATVYWNIRSNNIANSKSHSNTFIEHELIINSTLPDVFCIKEIYIGWLNCLTLSGRYTIAKTYFKNLHNTFLKLNKKLLNLKWQQKLRKIYKILHNS